MDDGRERDAVAAQAKAQLAALEQAVKDEQANAAREAKLEALRLKYGKIGAVDFNGHTVVFRKPTRDHVREYRRKMDGPEKPDAMDQLAQATIVVFDDEEDPNRARTTFTNSFLEEYPLAISHPRFVGCLSALAGLIEEEDAADLGKGVTVRSALRKPSPTVSPNG